MNGDPAQRSKAIAIGLGAGGHARSIIDALGVEARIELLGLLDPKPERWRDQVLGVPVLGGDELIPALRDRGANCFFVGRGGVGDNAGRSRLFAVGLEHGLAALSVIHPAAIVARSARLGRGIALLAGAIVNAGARLGDNAIVNSGAIVEHDCVVGDHVHVATGALVTGSVKIGDGAHIGAGAVVRQGLSIGAGAVVGAGGVVVEDVAAGSVVGGVPARPLRGRPGAPPLRGRPSARPLRGRP